MRGERQSACTLSPIRAPCWYWAVLRGAQLAMSCIVDCPAANESYLNGVLLGANRCGGTVPRHRQHTTQNAIKMVS